MLSSQFPSNFMFFRKALLVWNIGKLPYASLQWRRKGRGLSRGRLTPRTACIGGRIAVISEPCTNALLWLSEPCTSALLWRSGWLSRRLINELALGIGCILAAAKGVLIAMRLGLVSPQYPREGASQVLGYNL